MTASPIRIVVPIDVLGDEDPAADTALTAPDLSADIAARLVFVEACTELDLVAAGVVVGRYPTAGGAQVTISTTEADAATAAPGWVAVCGGCGWTDDQFACWHELWPEYPNIAGGDVRGLLLDAVQEHADTCEVTR